MMRKNKNKEKMHISVAISRREEFGQDIDKFLSSVNVSLNTFTKDMIFIFMYCIRKLDPQDARFLLGDYFFQRYFKKKDKDVN